MLKFLKECSIIIIRRIFEMRGELVKIDLSTLRDKLIKEKAWDAYREILLLMKNPYGELGGVSTEVIIRWGYGNLPNALREWHKNDSEDYKKKILLGQAIIWECLLQAHLTLLDVNNVIGSVNAVFYENNYLKASEQVYKVLDTYSLAKAAITNVERILGVDRYLDKIAWGDFICLVEAFDNIHKNVESLLREYKVLFVQKWNTANVYETVLHKLVKKNMGNQVCSLLQGNKKRVILFVIDGFGMGQYLWSKKVVPANKNFTYSVNVFEWLAINNLCDEFILGAPLVSDTAAGLSQIFIGKTAKETRVISSTVKREGSGSVVAVKSENYDRFNEIVDCGYNSFTVDIAGEKDYMKIYYCSKYDMNHVSGFSKYIFDGADVKAVVPPERVYSFLHEDFETDEEGATVVYITSIDNSGHVMGSFSQFERYEHEKINTMIKNFLIDLARQKPHIFDGNTSIILTADHGMTESYRINVSRFDVQNVLSEIGETPRIIEANRALFLYGISESNQESVKEKLKTYFSTDGIEVLILSKGDPLYDEYVPDENSSYVNTTPDIMILFVSEGIFYSKNVGESLMHFGGHGGHSLDEVFVPLVNIELSKKLLDCLQERFLKLS